MSFQFTKVRVTKVRVWSCKLDDRPGAAAEKLKALAAARADLQFVLGRREPDFSGRGSLFVAPIRGNAQEEAAKAAGFQENDDLIAVRVEGMNKTGLGSSMTEALSEAGVNLAGLTGVVTGKKFTAFIAFDNSPDAERGLKVLRRLR
jgi:hypothetical protein